MLYTTTQSLFQGRYKGRDRLGLSRGGEFVQERKAGLISLDSAVPFCYESPDYEATMLSLWKLHGSLLVLVVAAKRKGVCPLPAIDERHKRC
jgi:hypothetical protein